MKQIEMTQLCAHIGNVIRMAAILELEEIDGACDYARHAELHAMLNDPLATPAQEQHSEVNRQLLDIFRRFRYQIESVCATGQGGASACPGDPAGSGPVAADGGARLS